jgi:8-oxo-dGTP pyrophosphatase MutT (NUDIX family)
MAEAGSSACPRDAASLVIVDCAGATPKVLLGRRRMAQVFAPGKYVFPGGSLDAADLLYNPVGRLAEPDRFALRQKLAAGSEHLPPEAFALAAIRETLEETGLVLGVPGASADGDGLEAYRPFHALGLRPNVEALSFFARAITPPGRPKRFDARFMLAEASAIAHQLEHNDGEFVELVWVDFPAARRLDLHAMTREILGDAERFLAMSLDARRLGPVPFYSQGAGCWQRQLLYRHESHCRS